MFRGKLSLLMQLPKNKTHWLPIYRQIDNHNNKHLIKQTDAFATFKKFKSGLVWIKSGGGRGQGFLWQNRTWEHQWINVLNATSSQPWSVEKTWWFQSWLSGLSVLYYYFIIIIFLLSVAPGCSKLGQDNPGTVWNLNSEYKSGMTGRLGIWIPV